MKTKQLSSKRKRMGQTAHPDVAVLAASDRKGEEHSAATLPPCISVTHLEFPPADYLLEKARGESNRKLIEDYRETIEVLRDEKGFSFREIGDWLTANGVEADYNAVYRVYTKGMSEDEERDVALRDAQEEHDAERGL
jgi:hypothetical protein